MEQINIAVSGWFRFTSDGKLVVLFLGALLFLWYGRRTEAGNREKWLLGYAALSGFLALLPVTAAGLMTYMTRFYDYEWIWSVVPVTLIVAYAGAVIYTGCYEKYWKDKLLLPICFCALGIGVLVLCGGLGKQVFDKDAQAQEMKNAGEMVDYITQNGKNKDIILLGPSEIMEYVREIDGNITLPYGRNMWEEALGAYSYDVYEPQLVKLYQWMESLGDQEDGEPEAAGACMETAVSYGVNVMILPSSAPEHAAEALAEAADRNEMTVEADEYMGYHIYRIYESRNPNP